MSPNVVVICLTTVICVYLLCDTIKTDLKKRKKK